MSSTPTRPAPRASTPRSGERFYRTLYSEQLPVTDTLVISRRGTVLIQGITFRSRFRFSHRAGVDPPKGTRWEAVVLRTEEVLYDADLSTYLRGEGP
jgi:hypothetical protein